MVDEFRGFSVGDTFIVVKSWSMFRSVGDTGRVTELRGDYVRVRMGSDGAIINLVCPDKWLQNTACGPW